MIGVITIYEEILALVVSLNAYSADTGITHIQFESQPVFAQILEAVCNNYHEKARKKQATTVHSQSKIYTKKVQHREELTR